MFDLQRRMSPSVHVCSWQKLPPITIFVTRCHSVTIFVTWSLVTKYLFSANIVTLSPILSPGVNICSQGQLSPGGGGGGSPGDGGGGSPGDDSGGSPGEREGDGSRMPPPKAHSWTPIFTQ